MTTRIADRINALRFFAHDFVGFFRYAYRYYFSIFGGLLAGCA